MQLFLFFESRVSKCVWDVSLYRVDKLRNNGLLFEGWLASLIIYIARIIPEQNEAHLNDISLNIFFPDD